jgi:hypothetical protein
MTRIKTPKFTADENRLTSQFPVGFQATSSTDIKRGYRKLPCSQCGKELEYKHLDEYGYLLCWAARCECKNINLRGPNNKELLNEIMEKINNGVITLIAGKEEKPGK